MSANDFTLETLRVGPRNREDPSSQHDLSVRFGTIEFNHSCSNWDQLKRRLCQDLGTIAKDNKFPWEDHGNSRTSMEGRCTGFLSQDCGDGTTASLAFMPGHSGGPIDRLHPAPESGQHRRSLSAAPHINESEILSNETGVGAAYRSLSAALNDDSGL